MAKRAEAKQGSLPSYKTPPVNEVAFGVLFPPVQGLLLPHLGLFWSQVRDSFPKCEHAPPSVSPGAELYLDPASGAPWPRILLISADGQSLIQLQIDRFLFNWRTSDDGDEYPRFATVYSTFKKSLQRFQAFLAAQKLPAIQPQLFELTYFNWIPQGEAWTSGEDLDRMFKDFTWRRSRGRFLPPPVRVDWGAAFEFPDGAGTLSARVRPAIRKRDQKQLMNLELTARGFGGDPSEEGVEKWFSGAHEWIVRGFADMTTERIQKTIWGRESD